MKDSSVHVCEPGQNQHGFQTSLTQTELNKHRRWLETGNFGLKKKKNCTIRVGKTKALISFAVTTKLICTFVFAYTNCWFCHDVAHVHFQTRTMY